MLVLTCKSEVSICLTQGGFLVCQTSKIYEKTPDSVILLKLQIYHYKLMPSIVFSDLTHMI